MRVQISAGNVQWLKKSDFSLKVRCADAVYRELEKAYQHIGGINLGSGFKDPSDMLHSIPVWRLVFEQGRLASVMMFKIKSGRLKMVAYAANGASPSVKKSDFECMVRVSYAELSGALLIAVLRHLGPAAEQYLPVPEKVIEGREIVPLKKFGASALTEPESVRTLEKLEREFPRVLSHLYVRKIGALTKLKLLVGTFFRTDLSDLPAAGSDFWTVFSDAPAGGQNAGERAA